MSIILHIERIVLDGVSLTREQRDVLRASLESQLGVLLSQPSTQFDSSYAIPFVRAPHAIGHADPAGTGRAIADSIHSTITPVRAGPSLGGGGQP
jgi:hypothetical protein